MSGQEQKTTLTIDELRLLTMAGDVPQITAAVGLAAAGYPYEMQAMQEHASRFRAYSVYTNELEESNGEYTVTKEDMAAFSKMMLYMVKISTADRQYMGMGKNTEFYRLMFSCLGESELEEHCAERDAVLERKLGKDAFAPAR